MEEVGRPLVLTDFISRGEEAEGVSRSKVTNILQAEVSYSGYLRYTHYHKFYFQLYSFPSESVEDSIVDRIKGVVKGKGAVALEEQKKLQTHDQGLYPLCLMGSWDLRT